MKIIILLLLTIFSSAVEFNTNSIVSIYDVNGNGMCPGVIIADKYVISGKYCEVDQKPSYIRYKEMDYPVIGYKSIRDIVLFKTSMVFEVKDFVAISPYNSIFLEELPASYTKIPCDKDVEINFFAEEFDQNLKSLVIKQFILPIANYSYRNGKIIIKSSIIEYQQKVDYDKKIKKTIRVEREVGEEKTNADKFFLWHKCYGKYTLEGIYKSKHKFVNLTYFHNDIADGIINLLNSDIPPFNSTDANHDIGMNRSVWFVDIPKLSDYNVNDYLRRIIHDDWIDINGKKQKIPFRSSKVTTFPCETKLDLMTLYLYKFRDADVKFVKIILECNDDYKCFRILGSYYFNHVMFGYRSLESNKIMIVDPAVSDESFPLSFESLDSKGMFNHTLNRETILAHLTYIVSAPNIGDPSLIFWLQQEMKINDEVFRKVIDRNSYCLNGDSIIDHSPDSN